MQDMTTQELTEELELHDLTAAQIKPVPDTALAIGQVEFQSPATGGQLTVVSDDDLQNWRFGAR